MPWAGPVTVSSVIGSSSGSVHESWIVLASAGGTLRVTSSQKGAPSSEGVTVISTVTTSE